MTQAQTQTQTDTVTFKIDGQEVVAPRGATILEAARLAGIYIPTLCYDERLKSYGACRMCMVQQDGRPGFAASCVTPGAPDASYRTNLEETVELRQSVLNLLMSEHPHGCLTCDRIVHCGPNDICLRNVSVTDRCVICPQNQRCELQATVEIVGVTEQLLPYAYRQMPVRTEDPYIDRDYNLCIACARCVRICDEVIGVEAISMVDRGDRILPGTPNNVPLSDPLSDCTFCGACVDACPVGALTEKDNKWSGLPDTTVSTVCTQCEIGCQMTAELKDGQLLRVVSDLDGGANHGLACILGKFQIADEARNEARLLNAQIRRNGGLEDASWDDAVAAAADGFRERRGEAFALVVSPKVANEDAYLLQKFARTAMASANVTNTAYAVAELTETSGGDVARKAIETIADSKVVILLGADLEQTHPVAAYQVHKAVNYQDAALIGIGSEPYKELGRAARMWLQCPAGDEPQVLSAIIKIAIDEELIEQTAEGYNSLRASIRDVDPEGIATATGVSLDDLQQVARLYFRASPASIVYSATAQDSSEIAPLLTGMSLLAGNEGRVHTFRPGDGNIQGLHDMGVTPDMLPGYRSLAEGGLTAGTDLPGIVDGILDGDIKALYWVGVAPDLPDDQAARFKQALDRVEFLVAQGLVLSDDIAANSDVILPAAAATEREGTYTNVERRIQRVRPILPAPESVRPVWQAPAALGQALGADGFAFEDSEAVFTEIAQTVPQYVGLSYQTLDDAITGPVWPLSSDA